jgi:hypothetical protein
MSAQSGSPISSSLLFPHRKRQYHILCTVCSFILLNENVLSTEPFIAVMISHNNWYQVLTIAQIWPSGRPVHGPSTLLRTIVFAQSERTGVEPAADGNELKVFSEATTVWSPRARY